MANQPKRATTAKAPVAKAPEPAKPTEAKADKSQLPAPKRKRNPSGTATLKQITVELKKIAASGQAHEAAAGLQAARAALMDIARLNGLEPEGPAAGTVTWEELLAAIPDDDEPAAADRGPEGDAGAGGPARPAEA